MNKTNRFLIVYSLATSLIVAGLTISTRGQGASSGQLGLENFNPRALAGELKGTSGSELTGNLSRAFVSASKRVRPAVVHIEAEQKVKVGGPAPDDPHDLFNDEFFRRFFGPRMRPQTPPQPRPREHVRRGQGSGVIVDGAGHIITNNHVVGNADRITVRLSDKRKFEARLIGGDARSDVAVIKIEAEDLPVAATGDSDRLEVGEWVLAIGNPFGLDQTVTAGVVSAKGRAQVVDIQYQDFIQTDAAINPGNSGGPLVNLRGEVVGINTAIFSRSGGYMGIGFAIPINMARKIMKSLVDHGKVIRGWLGVGIQNVDDDMAKALGLPAPGGAMVTEVVKDSPAARAGIRERDVIVSLGGRKIADANSLSNKVGLTKVGEEVEVKLYRKGKETTLTVTIAERTAEQDSVRTGSRDDGRLKKLGLAVENIGPENRRKHGIAADLKGVLVTGVDPGSPADSAGLRPGMVIQGAGDSKIGSVADLRKELGAARKRVLLKVVSKGRPFFLAMKLK